MKKATIKITLKSNDENLARIEAEAITYLHQILLTDDLIGMAEFAQKNPDFFSEIAETIRSKKWAKLATLPFKIKL